MRNPCKSQSLEEFTQALGRGAEPNFVNTIEPIVVRAVKPFSATMDGRIIQARAGDVVDIDPRRVRNLVKMGLVDVSIPNIGRMGF